MTYDEKKLMMKDLCGRVPYGVKFTLVGNEGNIYYITGVKLGVTDDGELGYFVTAFDISSIEISGVKPYLRPIKTMTEEESKELSKMGKTMFRKISVALYKELANADQIEWLNEHMFDYRGLIPMGLALEAPEDMYNN